VSRRTWSNLCARTVCNSETRRAVLTRKYGLQHLASGSLMVRGGPKSVAECYCCLHFNAIPASAEKSIGAKSPAKNLG